MAGHTPAVSGPESIQSPSQLACVCAAARSSPAEQSSSPLRSQRTETEYRYEVSRVAESTTAFAEQVRSRYLFTLSGLSEEERAVVEEAIDETYFEDSEAFRSVFGKLQSHRGIEITDSYGTWLVAYEGEEYITYAER